MVEIQKLIEDRTAFWRYALMRFVHDKSVQRAAGLSYTTLLAMVPFLAVALTVLSAFPVFDQFKDQIMSVVLNNFLPETGEQVTDYLGNFLQNTGQMTAVGTMVLGLTAVMLLGAIEGAMNDVFRVTSPRKLLSRLVVFWALLTVGPMLLGLSLSLASYLFAMRHMVGGDLIGGQLGQLTFIAPFLLSAIAFSLLFIGMPNRSVEIIDGFLGGLVAAGLFEALKKGFGFYVTNFPTYQTIYGAVAIVPIFLLWMYLTWIVILLGAQVAAARSEWRAARAAGLIPDPRGAVPGHMERIIAVLRVLEYLQNGFHKASKPPTYRRMMREVKLGGRDLNWALAALRREKLIDRSESHRWLLSGNLSRLTLNDLMGRLGLFLDYDRLLVVQSDGGWPGKMRERLVELEKTRGSVLDVEVGALLDTPKPEDKVPEQIKPNPDHPRQEEISQNDMAQSVD
ncbi:MAG: trehalose-binding protein [Thalassospira sp.]|uniref:YihY family inner membrane protein n=1 Tax=Thalassospira sp. GB04J01 TaxID=1485225 RepID=UPI000C112180|nr:YihY family inner membrane protein [Thalassospira sp. GB04J01]MBV17329.1 trehalose-binding protein [Thalassospira sp.]|tara:strand:+ start:821 stop:2179 length:1359 start_codon:yes stop_codon:yes gene_type:complete